LANMFFAEETMTKAEAEAKFGIRIVDWKEINYEEIRY
jgi:hypothetical protein